MTETRPDDLAVMGMPLGTRAFGSVVWGKCRARPSCDWTGKERATDGGSPPGFQQGARMARSDEAKHLRETPAVRAPEGGDGDE